MRIISALPVLVWSLVACSSAFAQYKYDNWQDVCRHIGSSTGACAPKSQLERPLGCVRLVGNAFHAEKAGAGGCIETTLAPADDAQIFVELVGLPNTQKINELKLTIGRTTGFKNAVALFHNGSRMIVHDPAWARSARAEFYLVLGHEAGHHICGHTVGSAQASPQEAELEADRFSGASIKRFEVYHGRAFLGDALKAAERLYSAAGSRSHPPRADRVAAIMLGYNAGSPCGNLAPPIRGFTAPNRFNSSGQ
jgi:hypothetical protein